MALSGLFTAVSRMKQLKNWADITTCRLDILAVVGGALFVIIRWSRVHSLIGRVLIWVEHTQFYHRQPWQGLAVSMAMVNVVLKR